MGIISKLLSNSPVSMEEMRAKAAEQFRQDNYKDAYETLHELLKMPENTGWLAGKDYVDAVNCLHRLHRNEEMDALRDEALALRPADWEFAAHCAESFRVCPYGMVLEGRFVRDNWSLNVEEQDRHFWMKALLERPVPADGEHLKDYYLALIRLLLEKREIPEEFWRFQILTDVTIEPDYTQEYDIQGGSSTGIPVDENGAPLFFAQPDSWEDAKNDGERLRWLFKRLAEAGGKADSLKLQAKLFWECYGTQEKGRWLGVNELDIKKQLRKLSDDETWTSLATGDRRFLLPSEFNPIHLCRELAELGEAEKLWAYGLLMDIYEARYQFEKAEELCEYIAKHSPDEDCRRRAEDHLREIRGNWCGINGNSKQLAGKPATIDLSFRNAFSASFVAYKIDLERLVKDTWKEIEGGKLEYYSFPELSHNLSTREWTLLTKYLMDGKASGPIKQGIVDEFLRRANCKELSGINPVAVWSVSLTPEEGHLDTIKTLTTPFQEAGAYVVFCQAPQGNTDAMVIVMQELEIIEKKLLGHKLLWQVLDSKTGAPQANMPLDCLLVTERERLLWKNKVCSKALTRQTDKNGFVVLSAEEMLPLIDMKSVGNIKEFEKRLWKIDSTFKEIRLFGKGKNTTGQEVFFSTDIQSFLEEYGGEDVSTSESTRCFLITDRPVYRPGQQVHIKIWEAAPTYGEAGRANPFAFTKQSFVVIDGDFEKLCEWTGTLDAYGGATIDFELPKEVKLGSCRVVWNGDSQQCERCIGSFQVEEYKKDEFEVTVELPQKPLGFGESVPVVIRAEYYWGAPVTEGSVSLKVTRRDCDSTWRSSGAWDWLYGKDYGLPGYDYDWYPGWKEWGFSHARFDNDVDDSPEKIMDLQGMLANDGSFSAVIDTSSEVLRNDACQQYDITAEVRDESRRVVIGTGSFKVSQKPYRVFVRLDHGYLSVGDKATAIMEARDVDGNAVVAHGALTLKSISYDDAGQPQEKSVCAWKVSCGKETGRCEQPFSCSEPGQYRLSCQLTDEKGQTEEGGLIFSVIGSGSDGRAFHYNGLELVLDKDSYSPGETVRLLVNTEQADSTVMLFVRPLNGKVPMPQLLHLGGKGQIVEIPVREEDRPNFFIEAYTLCNGRLFEEMRKVVVPPAERFLNVEILPSKLSYLPGEEGTLGLRVTDSAGRPVRGDLVVTVYDKSLEAISPSAIKDIRRAFWKFQRKHFIRTDTLWNYGTYVRFSFVKSFSSLNHTYGFLPRSIPKDCCEVIMSSWGGYGMVCAAGLPDAAPEEGPEVDNCMADIMHPADDEPVQEKSFATALVRKYFADTALWAGKLETDETGSATVKLPFPDDLTTWKIRVWCMAEGTCVGEGTAEVKTSKNLVARLQAPRFFVEKDEVVISANIHNYLAHEKLVKAELELEGACLELLDGSRQTIPVPMQGEQRVDWRVKAVLEGTAVIRVKALTDEESDAVEQSFPVQVHGMEKSLASCLSMRSEDSQASMVFDVPAERRPETARLEIRWSPSLVLSMVEALPYLLEYPYGCTEQTLNRFLPALQTKLLLEKLGLKLADVKSFSERLNTQAESLKELFQQTGKEELGAVWDDGVLADIVDCCIERLRKMQCSDGGWGWFSGRHEYSGPHTTVLVVQGLLTASHQCGLEGLDALIRSGVKWLDAHLRKSLADLKKRKDKEWAGYELETNALVFRVLSEASSLKVKTASSSCLKTGRLLFEAKSRLSMYGLALLGLGMHFIGDDNRCEELIHNLRQYERENAENQTAWLDLRGSCGWFWFDDELETQATFVKLLALRTPQDERLPWLVKYMLNNRRHGAYWKSTRDTGVCLDALATYILNSNEMELDMRVELQLDGKSIAISEITPKNLASVSSSLVLKGEDIKAGRHELAVVKSGKGALYVSASLRFFSLEDFISEAGLEIKVRRRVWRLFREDRMVDTPNAIGRPTQKQVEHFRREGLNTGDAVNSGDLLEVELVLESQNDYEYLLLEDMLAAGTVPVDTLSGYNGNEMGAYMEIHDNRVSFFIRELSHGRYSLTYRLRAEVPGHFSALPARISAMYDADLCGNSSEHKLTVKED